MRGARPAVLIVDDVEANLVALEAQLGRLECDIVRASSGNQALAELLRRDFAVALLDVQMPEMDGFEVARLARADEQTSEVPIVFVTAMRETEESQLRGYGAGAIDVLFKPVNAEILRSKVRVFLDLWHGRRRLADEIEAHRDTMRELEAFNFSVSHDLRAPIRQIDGFARILEDSPAGELDRAQGHHLARIRDATAKMSALIDDLLALSASGRKDIALRPIDLAAIARTVADELAAEAPDRQVRFVSVDEAQVDGDPGLMRIVFENLLRNAWKFTRKVASPRVELGAGQDGGRTVYYLRDNGAGFDPALADRLFEPFRRLHAQRDFEGNGVGLAIVQRILRRHGGTIWAESTPGQGATFYFTLHDWRR